jgi:methylglutaconyl-CoA hydratase
MLSYKTIVTELKGQVATLWLARPEVHNALNDIMIREISTFFTKIEENNDIRIIVIRGEGKSFCSGADLVWMKQAFSLTPEENLKESKALSDLFGLIFNSSKIVIAAAHGNVFGGGNGLLAACDLAYGVADAKFSLSETRIGMAAASITPYLLNKVHSSDLKELIFSAKIFDGNEAFRYGLLNKSFASSEVMELYLNGIIEEILVNGKQALIESKKLINLLTEKPMAGIIGEIPELLARIRISPEAREGFSAFLEKRKPRW